MMDGKGYAHEPAGTPKGGRFARKTMFDADGDLDCAPIPAADRAARLQERYGRRWERLDPDCRYDDTRLVVSYMDGGTGVIMLGDCRDANTLDVLESGRPCGDIASIAVATPVIGPSTPDDTVLASVAPISEMASVAPVHDDSPAIPNDPDGQVEWLVDRAENEGGMALETLVECFETAGLSLSKRTIQRRLADARSQHPDAFAS